MIDASPTPRPAIPISGPLTLAVLLDRAFRLYRRRFRSFIAISALLIVPYALISGLVTGNLSAGYLSLLTSVMVTPEVVPQAPDELLGGFGSFFVATFALGLVGLAIFLINSLSLTSHALAALQGRSEPVGDSMRVALRRFWPALRMNILKFGGMAVIMVVLGIALSLLAGLLVVAFGAVLGFQSADADPGVFLIIVVSVLLIVGYLFASLLFVAPIIYLAARWQVALPGIVEQRWRAREALGASWRLTQGQTRRAVFYLILLWVLSFAITTIPTYLAQGLAFIVMGMTGSMTLMLALTSAVAALLYVFWQPLAAIAVALFYYDLRVRQEGLDIEGRIAQPEAELGESAPARLAEEPLE